MKGVYVLPGKSRFLKSHICVESFPNWISISSNDNMPIYLLDKNPELLAKSLTTKHIKQYIEYIIYSVIVKTKDKKFIKSTDANNKKRVDYMFSSQRTLYFFCKLYSYMQEVYSKRFGNKYKVCKDFDDSNIIDLSIIGETLIKGSCRINEKERFKGMNLCSPVCIYKQNEDIFNPYSDSIKINRWKDSNTTFNSNYEMPFRMMYMLMGYTNDEFPLGPPPWYHCMKQTIYNSYNMFTRLRTRIDTSIEGEYSYYYSVDNGDTWIEVKDMKQMKLIIDSIMYGRDW